MNIDQILQAALAASTRLTVKVASTDFYSRAGDLEDAYITFIDSDKFIEALEALRESTP